MVDAMSQRSNREGGRKRSHAQYLTSTQEHPNVKMYNSLVAAYRKLHPLMSHEEAKVAAGNNWDLWKLQFGLGLYFILMQHC